MRKVLFFVFIIFIMSSQAKAWFRTESKPFWSGDYRFKVWVGVKYKEWGWPNPNWQDVAYGTDQVNKGVAKKTVSFDKVYAAGYPFYNKHDYATQYAERSRGKSSGSWYSNIPSSRAYKKSGDTLQTMTISFNDSIRNDTFFIDSLTGIIGMNNTGTHKLGVRIILWIDNGSGDENIDPESIIWEAGIDFSEANGYSLFGNMPLSGYGLGNNGAYNYVEFTNLASYFVLPSGINYQDIVITMISNSTQEEFELPTNTKLDLSNQKFNVSVLGYDKNISIVNGDKQSIYFEIYDINGQMIKEGIVKGDFTFIFSIDNQSRFYLISLFDPKTNNRLTKKLII